jgi:hypothetical protein
MPGWEDASGLSGGNDSPPAAPDAAAAARRAAFALLKPACSRLLQLRADAPALRATLDELHAALAAAPAAGLAACWDYVAWPLFIALDSGAAIRKQREAAAAAEREAGRAPGLGNAPQPPGSSGAAPVPAAGSDRVMEGLMDCLLALARRAPPAAGDQLAPVLEKLLPLLQLGPEFASEEVGGVGVGAGVGRVGMASGWPLTVEGVLSVLKSSGPQLPADPSQGPRMPRGLLGAPARSGGPGGGPCSSNRTRSGGSAGVARGARPVFAPRVRPPGRRAHRLLPRRRRGRDGAGRVGRARGARRGAAWRARRRAGGGG